MPNIRCSLITEGSSDQGLICLISWLLHFYLSDKAIQIVWADMRRLPNPPRTLDNRIRKCVELYPCDLLFIHRDSDRDSPEKRRDEISNATRQAEEFVNVPPFMCIIPVRKTEAWFLFNEKAIRETAGNPNGHVTLEIPALNRIESIQDPKLVLRELLCQASEQTGRKLKMFERDLGGGLRRVSELIDDFSRLRQLTAFNLLERDLERTLRENNWI